VGTEALTGTHICCLHLGLFLPGQAGCRRNLSHWPAIALDRVSHYHMVLFLSICLTQLNISAAVIQEQADRICLLGMSSFILQIFSNVSSRTVCFQLPSIVAVGLCHRAIFSTLLTTFDTLAA